MNETVDKRGIWLLVLAFLILTAYSVLSTVLLGDKGFFNDDWAALSFPFWDKIPEAFETGARVMRRPTQSVYFGIVTKATGYDDGALFFLSLMQLVISYVAMGAALLIAFPRRYVLAFTAVLAGFFLPMITPGVYWFAADNMRLASVFYWLSVILFQHWALKPQMGSLPAIPILMYMLALLAYESVAALPVVTALLILPIVLRQGHRWFGWHSLIVMAHLTVSHVIAYGAFIFVRSVYQITSHVNAEGSQPLQLTGTYLVNLVGWVGHPFVALLRYSDWVSVLIGVLVAVGSVWIILNITQWRADNRVTGSGYITLVGLVTFAFGLLPFVIFKIVPTVGDAIDSRGFITAAYGLAILIGLGVELAVRSRAKYGVLTVFAVWTGVNAIFHLGIRVDYQKAYEQRMALHESLYELIPNVADDTVILYVGYDDMVGYAPVQAENVTHFYTKMFYQNRSVNASSVVPYETGFEPIVTDDSLIIPGGTVPLDHIVIVERVDTDYQLVDEITVDDAYTIHWQGAVTVIHTNPDRILPPRTEPSRFHQLVGFNPDS